MSKNNKLITLDIDAETIKKKNNIRMKKKL